MGWYYSNMYDYILKCVLKLTYITQKAADVRNFISLLCLENLKEFHTIKASNFVVFKLSSAKRSERRPVMSYLL